MAIRVRESAGAVVIAGWNIKPSVGCVWIADKPTVVDAERILINHHPAHGRSGPGDVGLLFEDAQLVRPSIVLDAVPTLITHAHVSRIVADRTHPGVYGHASNRWGTVHHFF